MHEKMNNNEVRLFSIVLTIISLLLFLFTDPTTSIAGDVNISKFISSNASPGFFFISPALAILLQSFAKYFSAINWWALFSVLAMFASECFILYYLQIITADSNKREKKIAAVSACVIWLMFFFEGINFTQTATLLTIAGLCAVLSIGKTSSYGEKRFRIIIALLFVSLAGAIRWKAMIMCIPYMLMVVIYRIILSLCKKRNIRDAISSNRLTIILAFMIVVVSLSSKGVHLYYENMDPLLKEWALGNKYREDIFDYRDRYPEYIVNAELYNELGVDDTWLNMVFNAFTSDQNHFSSYQLEQVARLRGKSTATLMDYIKTLKSHADAILILLLSIVLLAMTFGTGEYLLPFVLSLCTVIFGIVFFISMGRFPWRITNSFMFNAFASSIVMASENNDLFSNIKWKFHELKTRKVLTCLIIGLSLLSVTLRKDILLPIPRATNLQDALVMDYMNEHKENVYFTRYNFYYAWNPFTAKSTDYMDNHFMLESDFILGCTADKEKYGITDIVGQMISEPGIHTVYFEVWHDYLRHYYDNAVSAGVVESVPGTNAEFIRYCLPIETDTFSQTATFSELELEKDEDTFNDNFVYFIVHAKLSNNAYEYYYLNITDDDTNELYTYPLVLNDNVLSGKIIKAHDTWGEHVSFSIIGVNYNEGLTISERIDGKK